MNELLKYVQQQTAREISSFDFFKPGDNLSVTYKIIEGDKEREQTFRGTVIQIKGTGVTKTFTVRKISHGVGVERIFPFNGPTLVKVENLQKGRVRRARLFYLRAAIGKAARVREKKFVKKQDTALKGLKRKNNWSWDSEKKFG
jgi:large subunit ribosomal protein L19